MSPVRCAPSRPAGVALVLVLCVLVLLTALVIAFLTDAATDLNASKNYSETARAKLLADSAVNVVEGQIRAGVAGVDSGNNPLAWASQPGLIRTYDISGNFATTYKLYSSDTMQAAGTSFSAPSSSAAQDEDLPANWNTLPSDFVDLNSPALIGDPNGTLSDASDPNSTAKYIARFPVIDGNNLKVLSSLGTSAVGTTVTGTSLLGYDVDGDGSADIEGFSVQQPNTYNAGSPLSPTNNPVPMPVRWLYVLQNGELHARDPLTHQIADASSTNPVVGRMAFWTDDDTCKLNVNTASEGTFWGRPWVKTPTELNFASYLPAQNEFQMYAGHPAKTCLSTVFGSLWPVDAILTAPYSSSSNYSKLLPYYDLTPRVTQGATTGGSAGGTQAATSTSGIPYDADRLYASLDEIMFKPVGATATNTYGATRQARNVTTPDSSNAAPLPPISPQFLETTRFFLTASNRAPEVTLFNTPRLSLWPLQYDPTYRTAKDQLLAFCSTVPGNSTNLYAFQRYTATKRLTSPPIASISAESPTLDYTSVPRNSQLYGYLQSLLSSPVPGLGGNFQTKYGTGPTNQIIAEMIDQIRSGVNTGASSASDSNNYSYTQPQGYQGGGQVVPLRIGSGATVTGTGFGRFNTIVGAAVDFFRTDNPAIASQPAAGTRSTAKIGAFLILQPFNPTPGFPPWSPDMRVEVSGLDTFGYVSSADPVGTASTGLGFSGISTNVVDAISQATEGTSTTEFNGLASMFYYNNVLTEYYKSFAPNPGSGLAVTNASHVNYPFINTVSNAQGASLNVITNAPAAPATTATTFTFTGGTVKINIYTNPTGTSATPVLVQTLTMNFPAVSGLPVPIYNAATSGGATTVPTILAYRLKSTDGLKGDPVNPFNRVGSALIDPNDVVRSVIVKPNGPSGGDYRVITAMPVVPANYFTAHPFYSYAAPSPSTPTAFDPSPSTWSFNRRFAHNLRTGSNPGYGFWGWYDYGTTDQRFYLEEGLGTTASLTATQGRKGGYSGSLVANLPTGAPGYPPYYRDAPPAVPPGLVAAYFSDGATPGDWDTGYGVVEDGPYVNKPDEAVGTPVNVASGLGVNDVTAYFNRGYLTPASETGLNYSPNRQIASAVAFGSLPTGIDQTTGATMKPWQTLLFTAHPAAGLSHPGFGTYTNKTSGGYPLPPYSQAPDHAVLDLFTMPIVEPYAISEPLSTQGKVNMNYQIAPFTYIRRDTGVRAVMKSTWVTAIPIDAAEPTNDSTVTYKQGTTWGGQVRFRINPDEITGTLKAFEDRFSSGEMFRSASEICSVPLVPQSIPGISPAYPSENPADPTSPTYSNMSSWWNSFQLTGDNLREEPYGDLYPRLTTKSNTFTVHVRVQTLKKSVNTNANTFVDPMDSSTTGWKDAITAEYRGSYQIERYVDPNVNTAAFPDYATTGISATPIDKFYKFRTISAKQF